jgi:hypothetical protein
MKKGVKSTKPKKKVEKLKGNKNAAGGKGGFRPEKYKPEFNELAFNYSLLGADQRKLAELFEVDYVSIHNWKKKYPLFKDAIRRGGVIADAKVAHALYQRALGYEHPDEEIKVLSDNGVGKIVRVETIKKYAPDTNAAVRWLTNRSPDKWKDKNETEVLVKEVRQVFKIGDQEIEFS